ncbi:MAG TPA: aldolase [Acidobacteriaceae bacterium]|jgi:ribulose-5-phosphate 4-epimerase/fuculose-1-phosphate aldolase|nr:aldolase [Acidobacteriaceae bacterium]
MQTSPSKHAQSIRQGKIDLTAALRTAALLGLHEGVCNHFSLAIPNDDGPDAFLINPQGVHWSEMVPSDIVTVDVDGNKLDGHRSVEPTAFFIHGCVHRAKKSARCIMHTHMPYATSITVLEGGRLEWISQNSLRYYGRIAYDEVYGGLALDEGEGDRITSKLKDADILFMANHGVLLSGESVSNVFDDLYYLERACMVQVLAQSTGRKLKIIGETVAEQTARQFEQERQQSSLHFDALKLNLDRISPGWSELPE